MKHQLATIDREISAVSDEIKQLGELISAARTVKAPQPNALNVLRNLEQQQAEVRDRKAQLTEQAQILRKHLEREGRFITDDRYPVDQPEREDEEREYGGDPLTKAGAYSDGKEGILTLGWDDVFED